VYVSLHFKKNSRSQHCSTFCSENYRSPMIVSCAFYDR